MTADPLRRSAPASPADEKAMETDTEAAVENAAPPASYGGATETSRTDKSTARATDDSGPKVAPDPRSGARKAAEEAGRRSTAAPAASLLSVAPKPRRPKADKADPTPQPAIPGLPTKGKRDLTQVLRALNDPTAGEVALGQAPVEAAAASSEAPTAPAAPEAPAEPVEPASQPPRPAPEPVVRLTAPAPKAEPEAPVVEAAEAQPDDFHPVPSQAVPETTSAPLAAPEHQSDPDPLPLDTRLAEPEPLAADASDAEAVAEPEPAPAEPVPVPVARPAAARVAAEPASAPAPAEDTGDRGGLFSFAGRAMRLVVGRGREADAVARRQQALVAAVRQRDEAAARAASSRPAADTAIAHPSRENAAEAPAAEAPRRSSAPAEGDDLPVTLVRRGDSGLVGARRLRPGPRGPEDLVRLWLEHRGTGDVAPWSAFPSNLVGAQWPNTLLLTVDPEAPADGDAAGAFGAILRLDRADRPPPAGTQRIVYTPTMTEWILAMARESQRSSRVLRDRDEFVTGEGRLAVRLVALPLGEDGVTVDRVLCHLAAERPA